MGVRQEGTNLMDSVGVITLTRNRPSLLERAMKSVQKQKSLHLIKHLILVDGCEETKHMLENFKELPENVRWHWIKRESGEDTWISSRCGKLKNLGVNLLDTAWIACLDDDNEWVEDHIDTLLACAKESSALAVHSHRMLLYPDGTPFLEERYPWVNDIKQSQEVYRILSAKGVFTSGSCIMRDRVDPVYSADLASMIDPAQDPIMMVDASEWFIARELLLKIPFRERFTDFDKQHVLGEDAKFLLDLMGKRIMIVCTHKPTLLYYLGGLSNNIGKT